MCTLTGHTKGVHGFEHLFVSGRRICASCGLERGILVWNLETSDQLKTLEGHKSFVHSLACDRAADSTMLISLAADGELRTWDMSTYANIQVIPPSDERVSALVFNAQLGCLVTAERRLTMWQQPRKFARKEVLAASLRTLTQSTASLASLALQVLTV